VVSAFTIAFAVTFFFYWSNLRAETALERLGQHKLKRVLDSSLIGVARGRMSGRIEEANDAFLSLVGCSRQDLAAGDLNLRQLAPLDPRDPACTRTLAELRDCGVSSVVERTFVRKDGTAVPTLVGLSMLDEGQQEVVGFVLDLTEHKQIAAQEARLRESQEALRLRDLFDSIASHELKTPLTVLTLGLQILRRKLEKEMPASPALKLQAERCESSAARLKELVQALLDVAQIQEGKLKLSAREVDVTDAVGKVVGALEAGCLCRPHQVLVRAERAVTARIDALRFDQLVTNLISNAVKYGGGEPVEVTVREDGSADLVHLEVRDHGPGIDPSMLERIFQPFQRGVTGDSRIPGLGLGLYVVKMIVESHGGTVRVDSQPGRGSCFTVQLPRAAQIDAASA
jgi:PAS domain S-box-containing protein